MKLMKVEVIVRGRAIYQGDVHPSERGPTQYHPDTRFTYTTIAKPQKGDVIHWEGRNIEFVSVVEVLKGLTDGSGTTYTTDYFRVWA